MASETLNIFAIQSYKRQEQASYLQVAGRIRWARVYNFCHHRRPKNSANSGEQLRMVTSSGE